MNAIFISRYANLRTLSLLVFYVLVLSISYGVAYALRFDFSIPLEFQQDLFSSIWWVVCLKLCLLIIFGQFSSVLSYFRLPDAAKLFTALFCSSCFLVIVWLIYQGTPAPPRSTILADFFISFFIIACFRVACRMQSSRNLSDWFTSDSGEHTLIVGAGQVGAEVCSQLMSQPRLGIKPIAFLDDDPKKFGRFVHGIPVVGALDSLTSAVDTYHAKKIIIAFPSASAKRMRWVAEKARDSGVTVDIVPSLDDIVSGRASVVQLRAVQLEDLLGRDSVDLKSESIEVMLKGKRVIVTGAGGSIGSELVEQILGYQPSDLLCIDQAEIAVFELEQRLSQKNGAAGCARARILDVLDIDAARVVFSEFQPDVIFHAAAHKHVNLMESFPAEALKNNFFATAGLVQLATELEVERFILISTDKAINPTSIMGASKRLAELALQSQQDQPSNRTKFMAVRFGNVLGSSGSVIPIFRRQIESGGPLTVTDPEVTRFFMTVEEAVGLVLQSATLGNGGEIFVLDMGESMKIIDVAKQMIALSGLKEGEDIEIEITGLRPGEKLYEEVQHVSEALLPTEHSRVLSFVAGIDQSVTVIEMINELKLVIQTGEAESIKNLVQSYVPEYKAFIRGSEKTVS